MTEPTSVVDILLNFKRAIFGQHIWHKRKCRRQVYVEFGMFKLVYKADHRKNREEV